MFLSISTTYSPATDLGFVLHKHPGKQQTFSLPFGTAHVWYPEATEKRTTCCCVLDADVVDLPQRHLPYIAPHPYAATSFLSSTISKVFGSALHGRCDARPDLVDQPLPLSVTVSSVPRGSSSLFDPLGYQTDEQGDSTFVTLQLEHTITMSQMLSHLVVLLPTLGVKHSYVDHEDVEKLQRYGQGWLSDHPEHELIVRRFLKRQRVLVEQVIPPKQPFISLHQQRLGRVSECILQSSAERILDIGCGEGQLIERIGAAKTVGGVDVSMPVLRLARERVQRLHTKVELWHGSLLYPDPRMHGWDAVALLEVIEHIPTYRLPEVEHTLFGVLQPSEVYLTTPNGEYNAVWDLQGVRHGGHYFEWTRAEFQDWCDRMGEYGYSFSYEGIGDEHPTYGFPTHFAIGRRS